MIFLGIFNNLILWRLKYNLTHYYFLLILIIRKLYQTKFRSIRIKHKKNYVITVLYQALQMLILYNFNIL